MSPTCGYCRDCKWWDAELPMHPAYDGLGQCGIVHSLGELPKDERPKYLAFGNGYDDSGSLLTKPEFGCVQFEPKEKV